MKTNRSMEGFAMIEVLLAVVVLAIGLLAGSRMQMLGLSFSQGAMTRSYATMAANDIIDRMRLNIDGVEAGAYDNADTDSLLGDPGCMQTGCTPTQLAQADLFVWGRHFRKSDATDASTLLPPGATGKIEVAGDVHTVTITWDDFISGATDTRNITIDVIIK